MLIKRRTLAKGYFLVKTNVRIFLKYRHFIFANGESTAADTTSALKTLEWFEDDQIVFMPPQPKVHLVQHSLHLSVQIFVVTTTVKLIVRGEQLVM